MNESVERFYQEHEYLDEPSFCILCGIDCGATTLCTDCDEVDYSK